MFGPAPFHAAKHGLRSSLPPRCPEDTMKETEEHKEKRCGKDKC